jgi:hypothetical protein
MQGRRARLLCWRGSPVRSAKPLLVHDHDIIAVEPSALQLRALRESLLQENPPPFALHRTRPLHLLQPASLSRMRAAQPALHDAGMAAAGGVPGLNAAAEIAQHWGA